MQLVDSLTPCTCCNRGIFGGDAYCRHCGTPQKHSGSAEHPPKCKTIYLAGDPTSSHQKETLWAPVVAALQELRLDVHTSSDHSEPVNHAMPGWAYRHGQRDFTQIAQSGAIFIIYSYHPDERVMVDLGTAIALGKPTFLFGTALAPL